MIVGDKLLNANVPNSGLLGPIETAQVETERLVQFLVSNFGTPERFQELIADRLSPILFAAYALIHNGIPSSNVLDQHDRLFKLRHDQLIDESTNLLYASG